MRKPGKEGLREIMEEFYRGKAVIPQIVCLGRGITIAPGAAVKLDCPKTSILNVAFRIRATGPVNVTIEEYRDHEWQATEMMEVLEGETILHHILANPTFRLNLANPLADQEVTVSVDANLPRRF